MLKVHFCLTYILISTYSKRGGTLERLWSTRLHKLWETVAENKCNDFQNTENTRWVFSLLLLEWQHVCKTLLVHHISGIKLKTMKWDVAVQLNVQDEQLLFEGIFSSWANSWNFFMGKFLFNSQSRAGLIIFSFSHQLSWFKTTNKKTKKELNM